MASERQHGENLLQAPGRKTRSRLMKEHDDEEASKNCEVKMAETSLQQCLAALCNAGDSAVLKSLDEHSRNL